MGTLQGSVHAREGAAGRGHPVHHPRVADLVVERGRGDGRRHRAKAVQGFQQGDGLVAWGDVVRALQVRNRGDMSGKYHQDGSPLPLRQPIPTATSLQDSSAPSLATATHSPRGCNAGDAPGKVPEQCLRDWASPSCAVKSWARRVRKQAPKKLL